MQKKLSINNTGVIIEDAEGDIHMNFWKRLKYLLTNTAEIGEIKLNVIKGDIYNQKVIGGKDEEKKKEKRNNKN